MGIEWPMIRGMMGEGSKRDERWRKDKGLHVHANATFTLVTICVYLICLGHVFIQSHSSANDIRAHRVLINVCFKRCRIFMQSHRTYLCMGRKGMSNLLPLGIRYCPTWMSFSAILLDPVAATGHNRIDSRICHPPYRIPHVFRSWIMLL